MNVLDPLPCGVAMTNTIGRLLDANAELLSLVGGSRESRVGTSIEHLLPPARRICLQTHVWPTLLRDGRIEEVHLQNIGSDSTRLPVLLNSRLAENTSRALDKSQRFIKGITDAIPDLVAYWDKDLRCRFANQAHVAWFGRQPEDVIGITLHELLGDRVFTLNERHARAALAGQDQQFERAMIKADGTPSHTWAHYLPDIRVGEVRRFFAKISDVTELNAAQLALEEAQRLGQSGSWTWQADGDRVG
jgi:PAS domain-containing protein